ncbi:MAG: hypothetical protein ACOZF0_18245 [Thermodesulfobacteriota bacterium]
MQQHHPPATILKSLAVVSASVLMLLSGSTPCFSGAWTAAKTELYDRLSVNCYHADEYFNDDGDRYPYPRNGKFRDWNLGNYLEYGVNDRFTLINSLYYKAIVKEDDLRKEETHSLGDIDLGMKWKALEGRAGVLSAQGMVKIPDFYDEDAPLPVGNGQYDLEARLLYGRSLYPLIPGYYNVECGYRWRFEDPSDELRYLIEFGVDFTESFYGRIKLDGIFSLDNGEHRDLVGNPTTTNNFDLGKLDMALGYMVAKTWGLEIGYTPALYGKNTSRGATWTAAIQFRL